MTGQQMRELATAAVLGGVLAALGVGAALAGDWLKADAVKRELQVRKQALDASSRLARANDESQQIVAFQERYKHYLKLNAIRPNTSKNAEQGERLDWIERVVEAREAQALPRVVYSIAARRPYESGAAAVPGWSLQASRMKLELGLVHEGDFIAYLRRLASPPAGIFQIEQCTLQGAKAGAGGTGARAVSNPGLNNTPVNGNLAATCEIDWITLVEDATPAAGAAGATGTAARGNR